MCKLVKFLYGLKQTPKQWHEKFDGVMIIDEFTVNECDKCVYTKIVENTCIIVCLYVDDMLILGTNIEITKSTKKMLSNNFDMKDLGVADVILEIKITRTPEGISLSQSHYVNKMIERFKDHGKKENTNPFLPHIHLRKNAGTGPVGVFSDYQKSNVFNELH